MTDPERLLNAIRDHVPWAGDGADSEMLARFVGRRDEGAFSDLVARHGPMVLGVCRRVLGDAHRAEDVAQAVFFVLAREADRIARPDALAAWLHRTARHLSLKQRRSEDRRRRREASVARPEAAQPADTLTVRELLAAFDEELGRLPDRHRLPLILCYLEGCTQDEAAARLGWSAGSVKGRLERGRAALRAALDRRGVALPAALVAVAAGGTAKAGFVRETARAAVSYAAGAADSGVAAGIARGAFEGAAMFRIKAVGSLLLLLGVAALGAGIAAMIGARAAPKSAVPPGAPRVAAGEAPEPAPPTGYPLGDGHHWLPRTQSFRVRAEVRDERGPEDLARSLSEIQSQFPWEKTPDPEVFTNLQPVQLASVDCAFDRARVRLQVTSRTDKKGELNRCVYLWDGKQGRIREQYFRSGQDGFRLSPTPERVANALSTQYLTYLSRQPPVFWWNNTPQDRADFEQRVGKPADVFLVGREAYHGVDCHVFLSSVGNQCDRYYVGAKDGRWYGAKEGIIAFPEASQRRYQRTVERFLGRDIGEKPSDAVWGKADEELRALPAERKAEWCRELYAQVARDHIPVFEYWFSDFRDVGGGRSFPFREDFLFYGHEGDEKTFVSIRRTVTVTEVVADRPLEDGLFEEPLKEGATVHDEIHQPPLRYQHKARFNAGEWEAIVKKAAARQEEEDAERRKIDQLLGRPAPALPAGTWLNSKPLTWADLRGKIVILKFWSVGCAPCYGELPALRGPDDKGKATEDKDARFPIVYLGVHAAGANQKEIEKVVKEYALGAPICIDEGQQKGFFARCEVRAIPTSVAVDEEGRVIAHGTFSDVLTAATQRRTKLLTDK